MHMLPIYLFPFTPLPFSEKKTRFHTSYQHTSVYTHAHKNTMWELAGKVQQDMGAPLDAIASFRRAVTLDPTYFEAYASWGGALTPTRKFTSSLQFHETN